MVQQNPCFHAAPAAIFDEHHPSADLSGHLRRVRIHDREFGTHHVVFVKLTDLIEQL
jgi:hypothetical protein